MYIYNIKSIIINNNSMELSEKQIKALFECKVDLLCTGDDE
jgi:hypothetical protein